MSDKDMKVLTDEEIKKIEELSGVSKEKIDAAEQAQEAATDELKKHIYEYQRYADLAQLSRHLLGAMTQLNKYKDARRVGYWAQVVNHWKAQVEKVLGNKELFEPPLTKQLVEELGRNIERLKKLKPEELTDIRVIADDIQYRLGAVYGSLVSLDGIKQYAIEKRHSDLVEYVQNRITDLEDRYNNPTALETEESLASCRERVLELRGLIYHDNQSKINNDERSK